ncbi:hypothetical protein MASR1M48_00930 [Lactococcus petauri]
MFFAMYFLCLRFGCEIKGFMIPGCLKIHFKKARLKKLPNLKKNDNSTTFGRKSIIKT